MLNHDCVVPFEGHVGGMLVVQVGQPGESMETRAATGLSQHTEVAMDVICVEGLQASSEVMQDLQWLVVITA